MYFQRSNGTVDIDFYRREAILLRREAATRIFRHLWQKGRPLIGTVMIIVAYVCAMHSMFAVRAAAEIPAVIEAPADHAHSKNAAEPLSQQSH